MPQNENEHDSKVAEQTMECKHCHEVQPLSAYTLTSVNPTSGKRYYNKTCKVCRRLSYTKRGYRRKINNADTKRIIEDNLGRVTYAQLAMLSGVSANTISRYVRKGLVTAATAQ